MASLAAFVLLPTRLLACRHVWGASAGSVWCRLVSARQDNVFRVCERCSFTDLRPNPNDGSEWITCVWCNGMGTRLLNVAPYVEDPCASCGGDGGGWEHPRHFQQIGQ